MLSTAKDLNTDIIHWSLTRISFSCADGQALELLVTGWFAVGLELVIAV